MLPQRREVMGEDDCFQDLDQEGYRPLGNMLQGSVRYTVWARSHPAVLIALLLYRSLLF